jgi:hypothetical protein
LAEHLGVPELDERESVVAELDRLARGGQARLRIHPSPTENERLVLDVIDPSQLPFDPAAPEAHADGALFVTGLGTLLERFVGARR